ncbi:MULTISPECIES: hypothetical protein [Rhodococcus]|uniref:hypothetical protein n=1 Tax=Rhodococcus TaxID=1827 RepID=UPI000717FD0D|nr:MULTISPECIES: hypothetical protein [Rhodococcus]MCZ4618699.1 hypothetical protein [Rhodococcus qingshengii]MEA1798467.1 hypothetical protein [Rhodococcus qingshengii]ORI28808.1 hypothetical protein BH686_00755 [Rhodococcus erythropolis]
MAITSDQVDNSDLIDELDSTPKGTSSLPVASRFRGIVFAALAIAVLIFGGLCVRAGLEVRADNADTARDRTVTETASRIASQLVSLDHDAAQENLDSIAASATGSFRDQFEKISGSFATVLNDGQVKSTGEVKEIGIVDSDDSHATVLTAVTSTVKNTEAPEGQQRVYRMKMNLEEIDGNWLVSNVEFVA